MIFFCTDTHYNAKYLTRSHHISSSPPKYMILRSYEKAYFVLTKLKLVRGWTR